MIVLSAGMQRAGTRWYYNLIKDVLAEAGHPTALQVREEYNLDFLNLPNCNLRRLKPQYLKRLKEVSEQNTLFVVKTHCRPSPLLMQYLDEGKMKATYIYRDLRDVILSGLERGEKIRANGEARRYYGIGPYRTFARLHTLEGSIIWAKWQLFSRWKAWMCCKGVLFIRYEDLIADTVGQLKRLTDYIEIDIPESKLREIVDSYQRDRAIKGEIEKPRFLEKGVVGRHKEVFTNEQQQMCIDRLGPALKQMGYLD